MQVAQLGQSVEPLRNSGHDYNSANGSNSANKEDSTKLASANGNNSANGTNSANGSGTSNGSCNSNANGTSSANGNGSNGTPGRIEPARKRSLRRNQPIRETGQAPAQPVLLPMNEPTNAPRNAPTDERANGSANTRGHESGQVAGHEPTSARNETHRRAVPALQPRRSQQRRPAQPSQPGFAEVEPPVAADYQQVSVPRQKPEVHQKPEVQTIDVREHGPEDRRHPSELTPAAGSTMIDLAIAESRLNPAPPRRRRVGGGR